MPAWARAESLAARRAIRPLASPRANPERPKTFSLLALAGRSALNVRDLEVWLIGSGIARPSGNGSPDTLELTEYGLEVAREVDQLGDWLDDPFAGP